MEAVEIIRARAGAAPVALGLVLGSGLGHLADAVEGVAIGYGELPGFPHAGVSGHQPGLVIGELEGVRVAVLGGRFGQRQGEGRVQRRALVDERVAGEVEVADPRADRLGLLLGSLSSQEDVRRAGEQPRDRLDLLPGGRQRSEAQAARDGGPQARLARDRTSSGS